MTSPGFAVLDFETTGLRPERLHRIVELAIVHVDAEGRIEGAWETLVNPQRELGGQRIHGIRISELASAPSFDGIASRLIELLAGRVLVAHNASFEIGFLAAEFERIGLILPVAPPDAICTLRLARRFLPGGGRSLADSCAAYDIDLPGSHDARTDATATAHLLSAYLRQDARLATWAEHATRASSLSWPSFAAPRMGWITRAREVPSERSFLERAMGALPDLETTPRSDHRELEYLAALDQALADSFLSLHEADALCHLADELTIDPFSRDLLHRRYFDNLVAAVWADGGLSDSQRADIVSVARLLDIPNHLTSKAIAPRPADEGDAPAGTREPASDVASGVVSIDPITGGESDGPPPIELVAGDVVVLTGDLARGRSFYENALADLGMVADPAVTRRAKLLVAADIDTLSGKARKARAYGIPIVSESYLMGVLAS